MARPAPTRSRRGPPPSERRASGRPAPRRDGPSAGRPGESRWLFLRPPPRALALSGWALLPLRAFLGITFCFAALQKLANPNFFNAASPSSIQAQLIASNRISPLHFLLGHLQHYAVAIGLLIALSELAIGLGTLLGLWTRLAALGGMILSFTLFLTVSFHSSPYYTGADIVFFFAWMPLVLAGAGGVLSVDGLIASWTRREGGLRPPNVVTLPFSVVQQVCGNYEDDRCTAMKRAPCDVGPCPFLRQAGDGRSPRAKRPDQVDRRSVVLGGAAVAGVGAAGLIVAGMTAGLGRAIGGAPSPTSGASVSLPSGSAASATKGTSGPTTPTTSAPAASGSGTTAPPATSNAPKPKGTEIGPAVDVPVGGAASFTDPASGDPSIVLQLTKGTFVAYDAVCPHAGCTVGYAGGAKLLVCPCHGSEFDPANGDVLNGPAPTGLRHIPIAESANGQLYVDG
ncbi:MAG TPA: Rieske 2Fe-2S domain-containing protein [Acidimicrobiales bacterium]|nr:Rieske 2Fe-2S domain-containing protein [Acidimicrobiales bacterium]